MGLLSGFKIFAVLAIIGILAGGVSYVVTLKADLVTSKNNVVKLTDAVEDQLTVIDNMIEEIEYIQDVGVDLREKVQVQLKETKALNDRFDIKANGESRDFGKIARAKPEKIEKIINKGTKNVNRCFELITGATLKEGETNNECQEFINSIK